MPQVHVGRFWPGDVVNCFNKLVHCFSKYVDFFKASLVHVKFFLIHLQTTITTPAAKSSICRIVVCVYFDDAQMIQCYQFCCINIDASIFNVFFCFSMIS